MQKATLVSVLLGFVLTTAVFSAEETAELQVAFEAAVARVRAQDTEGFLSYWHPEAVIFVRDRLFPIDRSASEYDQWAAEVERAVESTISLDFVPKEVRYRVIGGTGIVWGLSEFRVDARNRPGSNLDSRFTAFFSKVDGQWKIVAWHASAPPTSRQR